MVKFAHLLGKNKPSPPEPVPLSHSFQIGDFVRLRDTNPWNPWKDTLRAKKTYRVEAILDHHIRLLDDTGNMSWYAAGNWFALSETGLPTMDAGEAEYYEAMYAQDLVNGNGKN